MENKEEPTAIEDKYRIQSKRDSFDIWVGKEENGNLIVLADEQFQELKGQDNEDLDIFERETVEFERPGWGLVNDIESYAQRLTMLGPILDEALRDRFCLKYLLKGLSFAKIELGEDEATRNEAVLNLDDLIGEKGIHPRILGLIVSQIRALCL